MNLELFTAVAATVAAVCNCLAAASLIRARRRRKERIVRKARLVERLIPRDERGLELQKMLDEALGDQR